MLDAAETAVAGFKAPARPRNIKNVVLKNAVLGLAVNDFRKVELKDAVFECNLTGLAVKGEYEIKNASFAGNEAAGLVLLEMAAGNIKDASFSDNAVGMELRGSAWAECKDDTFAGNITAVICRDSSAAEFRNVYVAGSQDCGFKIYDRAQPIFGSEESGGRNHFIGNKPFQIINNSVRDIYAVNNYWGTMHPDTVALQIWDGCDNPAYGIVHFMPLWGGGLKGDSDPYTSLEMPQIPSVFGLSQNAPNPCRTVTKISYALPVVSVVILKVYNISGQLVKTLVAGRQEPGYYSVNWDGKDNQGKQVANGVYLYRLSAGTFTGTKKTVMLR